MRVILAPRHRGKWPVSLGSSQYWKGFWRDEKLFVNLVEYGDRQRLDVYFLRGAAKAVYRVEVTDLPSPEAAFDAAAELWELCADLLAQPCDLVRQKDDELARRADGLAL